ncbi:hypothetical protein HMI55_005057 [Coelomomyces lativittatus]|nr:hypothetical protein HMI55_005057 [Coelomomyces lativittatus]
MSSLPQESRPNSGMSISKGVPVELSRTTFPVPPLPKPIPTQKHHEIEMMYFTPLGAGSEVGRSCHILKFKGKFIMVTLIL